MKLLTFTVLLVFALGAAAKPLVIAHRGASGYLPEHTIAAYELAISQGADFIEPDLVATRDGHRVARHDIYLSTTTNVSELAEFAERKRLHNEREDWYVTDFTLAELKQLKARQPFEGRPKTDDDRFEIPTFDEVLSLLEGNNVGVYPELKKPRFFQDAGIDTGELLLDRLAAHGLADKPERVFIQSFDPGFLKTLRPKTALPLIMLVWPKRRFSTEPSIPLATIAEFADGVGAFKGLILMPWSSFVDDAKSHGLEVHAWTFRNDAVPFFFGSAESELEYYLDEGVDGVFTDFPDTAVNRLNR